MNPARAMALRSKGATTIGKDALVDKPIDNRNIAAKNDKD
jgi:hypothetical protein